MAPSALSTLLSGWKCKTSPLALFLVLLAVFSGGLIAGYGQADFEGIVLTDETAPVYRKLPEIENQLYGHAYPNQAISQRISRVDRTLFGATQGGPLEARMRRIEWQINEKHSQDQLAENEPLLAYLENKLFQRTFENRPITERLRQLEVQVFGHSFDSYPSTVRLKKLTYAMPIMAKEIRLSKDDGIVIASTAQVTHRSARGGPPSVDKVQLDATKGPFHPVGHSTLNIGNYIQAIYRSPDGTTLRWKTLPIRVFLKPDPQGNTVTTQAIQAWRTSFPVEIVPQSSQADIIVTWNRGDWEQNNSNLLTRPVIHIDDHKNIRTIILITMYPLQSMTATSQLHAMTHQLGHAFGLWGHSTNPEDVMYPSLKAEMNDFPRQWGWRSAVSADRFQPDDSADGIQPSQRDVNTLLKAYDIPATPLQAYNPYPLMESTTSRISTEGHR
jgi:predicted Zn-dependent protease